MRAITPFRWQAVLGALAFFWIVPVGAEAVGPVDLPETLAVEDAVGLALKYNRTVQSVLVAREAQRFALMVAEDEFSPQLSLEVSGESATSRTLNTTDDAVLRSASEQLQIQPTATLKTAWGTRFTLGWQNQYLLSRDRNAGTENPSYLPSLNLQINQPLLRGAGSAATIPLSMARLDEQVNRLSLEATVSNTITTVVGSFFAVVRAQQRVDVARLALERAQELLEINRTLVSVGRMAPLDVVQAEADIAERELELKAAEDDLASARSGLSGHIGVPPFYFVAVELLEMTEVSVDPEEMVSMALARRTDHLQTRIAVERAGLTVAQAEDSTRWQLDLVLSGRVGAAREQFTSAYGTLGSGDDSAAAVGLRLSIPLTDLNREYGVLSARTSLTQAQLGLEESEEQVRREVVDAVRTVTTRWQQLQLAEQSLRLSEQRLAVEREKLQRGRSSNFEVVSFQDRLVAAQRGRIDAAIAYADALTALDRATGRTLETWRVELSDVGIGARPN